MATLEEHAHFNTVNSLREDLFSLIRGFENGFIDYSELSQEREIIEAKLNSFENEKDSSITVPG